VRIVGVSTQEYVKFLKKVYRMFEKGDISHESQGDCSKITEVIWVY
jgi:hypothetical protein